ncbi:MAG: hypothetical protein PHX30_04905 [Candidatus Pacebacteria bacterium]|nr:hypothetical protein [Candidatus Paceibacterota bacterium]
MNKKLLFVAVISMFLAGYGVTMAKQGNEDLTATSARTAESTTTNTGIACTDSDDGSNLFARGSVHDANRVGIFRSYDKCVDNGKLLEYTCKNDSWYASYYDCEFGCSEGACLAEGATTTTTTSTIDTNLTTADINAYIDGYATSFDVANYNFAALETGEDFSNLTDEQLSTYLASYLKNLNFSNADITDEQSLQNYLSTYLDNLEANYSAPTASNLPDGTLIKLPDDEKVYVIEGGEKEWIETAEEFTSEGYNWDNIQEIDAETLTSIQDQIRLIKDQLDKVYEIIGSQAFWIPNPDAFAEGGYDWGEVEDTNDNVQDTYEEATIVADEDGNLFCITENGKKLLITNQQSLMSLDSSNSSNGQSLINIDEIQALIDGNLQEALDGYISKLTSVNSSNTESSTSNKELENLWQNFTDDNSSSISSEFENQIDKFLENMNMDWQQFIPSQAGDMSSLSDMDWENLAESFLSDYQNDSSNISSNNSDSYEYAYIFVNNNGETETYSASTLDEAWDKYLANYDEAVNSSTQDEAEKLYEDFLEDYGYDEYTTDDQWSEDFQNYMTRCNTAAATSSDTTATDTASQIKAAAASNSVAELAKAWETYLAQVNANNTGTTGTTTGTGTTGTATVPAATTAASMAQAWADYLAGKTSADTTTTAASTPTTTGFSDCLTACMQAIDCSNACDTVSKCCDAATTSTSCPTASECLSSCVTATALATTTCTKDADTATSTYPTLSSSLTATPIAASNPAASPATSLKKKDSFLRTVEDVTLVQKVDDYKVYKIKNGRKTWIPTAEAFQAAGLKWEDIAVVNETVFDSIETAR